MKKIPMEKYNNQASQSQQIQAQNPQNSRSFEQRQQHDEIFNLFSPYILPPKFNLTSITNSQPFGLFSTDMRIIQTPFNNAAMKPNSSYCEDIQQEFRGIQNKIAWEKTPKKQQESQSQEESISEQSQSDSLIEEEKSNKQSSNNEQEQSQQRKKQQNCNLNTHKKRTHKNHSIAKQVPEPVTSNKKVICNCKKTKCLKLYCDCFRINQTCQGCNCSGCHNLQQYAQQRNNAIIVLMDRNPDPFSQKIQDDKHLKGCNCKKSNCLKKYCQCYQAGLKCGENCKCEQCKNCDKDFQRRKKDDVGQKMIQKSIDKLKLSNEKNIQYNELTIKKEKIMREI